MSLDAEGDSWIAEIKSFWNDHLPICLSLKDGYSYYALCLKDGNCNGKRSLKKQQSAPSFEIFCKCFAMEG